MRRAACLFVLTLGIAICGTFSRAQSPSTNAPHRLPTMEDIEKWDASSFEAAQRGADEGNTDAMVALYSKYSARGSNSSADCEDCRQALRWLRKAAEAGNAYGQCLLGYWYETPATPPPNMPEAVRWYRVSAEQGWSGAQYRLALCYLKGGGVEQDEERALQLLRQAADQGQTYATLALAGCYAKGIGTPRNDDDRPLKLYQRIAAKPVSESLYYRIAEAYDHIIFRYQYGVGTPRDIMAAAQWYCRAALKGMQYYTLADKVEVNTRKGRWPGGYDQITPDRDYIYGIAPDRWEVNSPIYTALSLYLKSARGDTDAMMRVGELYLTGSNVPQEPAKAHVWFMLAAQKGAKGADVKTSKAASSMSAAELANASKLLADLTQELARVSAAIR